jgi:hypothetical protein
MTAISMFDRRQTLSSGEVSLIPRDLCPHRFPPVPAVIIGMKPGRVMYAKEAIHAE